MYETAIRRPVSRGPSRDLCRVRAGPAHVPLGGKAGPECQRGSELPGAASRRRADSGAGPGSRSRACSGSRAGARTRSGTGSQWPRPWPDADTWPDANADANAEPDADAHAAAHPDHAHFHVDNARPDHQHGKRKIDSQCDRGHRHSGQREGELFRRQYERFRHRRPGSRTGSDNAVRGESAQPVFSHEHRRPVGYELRDKLLSRDDLQRGLDQHLPWHLDGSVRGNVQAYTAAQRPSYDLGPHAEPGLELLRRPGSREPNDRNTPLLDSDPNVPVGGRRRARNPGS